MIITAQATTAILCTALGLAASGGARSGDARSGARSRGTQEVARRVTQDSVRRDSVTRSCDTTITRTTAGALSGARIRSLDIQPNGPKALPGVGRFASHLHATTHSGTVRRDLQFAVHDTVDTTAVGESMRRLRHRSYIRDVALRGVRCGTDSVDLQVTTYDRWSLSASVGVQSNASYGGLAERNLLGTGREGSVSIASRQGKIGGAIGYTDPFLLNLPVYLKVRAARFVDGSDIRGRVRNADQSVTDRWRSQLVFARYRQDSRKIEQFGGRHPRSVIRSIGLDGAVFVATSIRTASALSQHDHFGVTALGAGLRAVPGGAGSGSLRLDILYPVLKSPGTRNGPILALSVTPWLQSNRQREDPRLR